MEGLRTALIAAHVATLAALFASALATAWAPRLNVPRRLVASNAVVMGLTGIALIGARATLELGNNGPKLAVKAAVLTGIVVLARRLGGDRARPRRAALPSYAAGIAALAVVNTAIALAWN